MSAGVRVLAWLSVALLASVASAAETLVLFPTADTSLFETEPNHNLGDTKLAAGTTVNGFRSRALLRFDVAGQLPENARVLAATVTLAVTKLPSNGGVNSTFDLFRVLSDWGEGDKSAQTGLPATAGEATWNASFHPTNLWSVPGGTNGVDFAAASSASANIANLGSYAFAGPGLASDFDAWRSGAVSNFGWVLISRSEAASGTARRFGSRGDLFSEPRLEIRYTVPVITNLALAPGDVLLQFATESNLTYLVEARDDFAAGTWTNVLHLDPLPFSTNRVFTNSAPGAQRFFRLRVP